MITSQMGPEELQEECKNRIMAKFGKVWPP